MNDHNAGFERRRKRIHDRGVPTFGKEDVSTAFNCLGCRKRKDGFRLRAYFIYEMKNNPNVNYEFRRKLGYVCSEVCFQMLVMRLS